MNRSLRFLSILMMSALVMAACSNGSGSPAASTAGGASAPAETAAGSGAGGSAPAVSGAITVTSLWGGSEQENFQKVLDAFTA
jgi:ABC-type glycerol-3-phosphate transport system substrate-binding protein